MPMAIPRLCTSWAMQLDFSEKAVAPLDLDAKVVAPPPLLLQPAYSAQALCP
eukprot:CAMPEP_0171081008 /NCGR_PEP_ID=MMETSP0766_2-20121228/16236_1 /TAXON_ID=439317 /ORGANISM="Gambierdiscus australes, Strain CAWD 149" /LENGTH=51 /DNA_ID=CAMNT_0011538293 /DNA_START=137 /DNA_END=289 /DNA_ORIENTATION=-